MRFSRGPAKAGGTNTKVGDFDVGLDDMDDAGNIKKVKKNGHCNGSHNKDDNAYQFQGLQEELIKDILIQGYEIKDENINFRG